MICQYTPPQPLTVRLYHTENLNVFSFFSNIERDLPIFFKRFYLFIFRERGREREREGEKHRCKRETSIGCLSYAPQPGTDPATQACALTRNETRDFLLCGTMSHLLGHTAQSKPSQYWRQKHNSHTSCNYSLQRAPRKSFSGQGTMLDGCSASQLGLQTQDQLQLQK